MSGNITRSETASFTFSFNCFDYKFLFLLSYNFAEFFGAEKAKTLGTWYILVDIRKGRSVKKKFDFVFALVTEKLGTLG